MVVVKDSYQLEAKRSHHQVDDSDRINSTLNY